MIIAAIVGLLVSQVATPVVTVDRDNVEITQSCKIKIDSQCIVDADNNGVIHVVADGITIDFEDQKLHGAKPDQLPDSFTGIGIAITAKNITLHNANVSGYKLGIHAINADGLTIHHCDISNNFHQRLRSTPKAEDAPDWLWPHANDSNEWVTNYGAGLCVEDSNNVTIHDIRARQGQNGIIFDRVNDSKVYDCDCSFLSGWGLALWRANRNVISRNAFDFCVRGYSHGVYNRGQDSAGILMFEQCCENVIMENSATHCGDGFFAFAGKEALGEDNPRDDQQWYRRRGCNDNLISDNDFSDAVAHGIEITFSFGNVIYMNYLSRDAICGIWAGYSSDCYIAHNSIEDCGEMAYGLERGGINIEHGSRNDLWGNYLRRNKCAIHLWTDDDPAIANTPWARANGVQSEDNATENNLFDSNAVDYHLRGSKDTSIATNIPHHVQQAVIDRDAAATLQTPPRRIVERSIAFPSRPGTLKPLPLAERLHLAGREHIIMTEWGPYDWASPLLQRTSHDSHQHTYKLLAPDPRVIQQVDKQSMTVDGRVEVSLQGNEITLKPQGRAGAVTPYTISLNAAGEKLTRSGVLAWADWQVIVFPSEVDPRHDIDSWHKDSISNTHAITVNLPSLNLNYQHNGPSQLNLHKRVTDAKIPKDHFGTIASANIMFPPGKWQIKTISDDGIRVWLSQKLVIDDWTHHGPTEHTHEFEVDAPLPLGYEIRVEHFELDGYAILSLDIEPAR
jgi:parallel beta-helix repeat protein